MKLTIKLLLMIIPFLLFSGPEVVAVNYYLSNEGNDSNSGTSPAQAWKTLDKLNRLIPKPGDSILFRRGDQWSGTVTVNMWGIEGRPIVYTAYGKGEKPVIYGSEKITGWIRHKGSVYKAKASTQITQLFVEDEKMQVARIPDSGYAYITEVRDTKRFSSDDLPSGIDYSGAVWYGRTGYYHTPVHKVVTSIGGFHALDGEPEKDLNVNEGFILMNKPGFISKPGEWSYDGSTGMVYLWMPNDEQPGNKTIRGTVYEYGFLARGKNHIEISNLEISHQAVSGIELEKGRFWKIEGNDFYYPDAYAVNNESTGQNIQVLNNRIVGANHLAIQLRTDNSVVSDNTILKTGLFDNIGISGTGRYYYGSALFIGGRNNNVKYNRIIDTHYNGIFFAGPENRIEYNFIENVCLVKGDGGAIYTTQPGENPTTGSVIRYNIVINSVGSREGYTSKVSFGEGIYVDESAHGVTVEHNTIFRTSNAGIKLHRTDANIIRNNTIMDARYAIQVVKSSGTTPARITDNIIYATASGCRDNYEPRQLLIRTSDANAILENNTYRNPYEKEGVFRGEDYCSFEEWTRATGYDKNSTFNSSRLLTGETERLYYNDTRQPKTFNLGNRRLKDINGKTITGSFTLAPFTSIILIGTEFI